MQYEFQSFNPAKTYGKAQNLRGELHKPAKLAKTEKLNLGLVSGVQAVNRLLDAINDLTTELD